mmetsp:Transcript_130513/g.278911  ORF Transcript_130513/g.278911 Transcript_130513/m.278911 type:complete len:338 (+) Transcript_130513:2217-3230(+)
MGRRTLATVAHWHSRPGPLGKADADLARVFPHLWDVLLRIIQVLISPDGLVLGLLRRCLLGLKGRFLLFFCTDALRLLVSDLLTEWLRALAASSFRRGLWRLRRRWSSRQGLRFGRRRRLVRTAEVLPSASIELCLIVRLACLLIEGGIDLFLPPLLLLFLPLLDLILVLAVQAPLLVLASLELLLLSVAPSLEALLLPRIVGGNRCLAALPKLLLGALGAEVVPQARLFLLQRQRHLIGSYLPESLGVLRVDLMEQIYFEERGMHVHLDEGIADHDIDGLRFCPRPSNVENEEKAGLILAPIADYRQWHRCGAIGLCAPLWREARGGRGARHNGPL